jgi:integrase
MAKRPAGKRRIEADGTVTVAGKAANGQNSIYLVGDTYRATYYDENGKRRTVSAPTKEKARQRRAERLAEMDATTPTGKLGDHPTVGTLVDWWLDDDVAAPKVRPATLVTYRKECARIVEHIGSVPLDDFDAEVVGTLLADLRRAGLAASTTRNVRTRLRQIAQQGVDLGYLRVNPVQRVPAPKAAAEERREKRVLDPDETRRLVAALDADRPLDAAVALLFTSGIRVSEALGLAWGDLDLDAGTAIIRRANTYTGQGVGARLDECKTTSTAGVHHLAPSAVALLRARRDRQMAEREHAGEDWEHLTYEGQPIELVFTTLTGGPQVRQRVTVAIRNACVRAGIDPTGVATHTGRRSVITGLYVSGVPLDDVARHVGHTESSTTAGYVTDLGTRPADTARAAAALFDPAVGES